ALLLGERPGLHDADLVAHLALVVLVVGLELLRPPDVLLVQRVLDQGLHGDHDGLVHLVADDDADAGLTAIAFCGHALPSPWALSSRSRRIVLHCAMALRTSRMRAVFSRLLTASWNRRLNSSSFSSLTLARISSVDISRISFTLMIVIGFTTRLRSGCRVGDLPLHELALDGQLVRREPQRLPGGLLVHAGDLKHDAAGLDDGDPDLRGALAGAHADLGGLAGQRLVGEDLDPHLAAAPQVTGDGDTGGLN